MKKILLSLCFSIPFIAFSQTGIISAIAGNGSSGFSGDGGPATAAQMGQALGVYVDGIGNIYIYDGDNGRIRKVNPVGIISTFAGGGSSTADGIAATAASINLGAIATDAYGNVYFVDGDRIRKVNPATGIITTVVGTGTGGYSGDGGSATVATINSAHGICFDAVGNLYIGDEGNARVRKVSTSGIISTFAGTGTSGYSGDGGPATAAKLQSPDGLCVDAAGNLYVADRYNYVIRKINASGVITTYAGGGSGGDGVPATTAALNEPSYVCIDNFNNLYIADFHNSRVRIVSPSGIINTFAGGGSSMSDGVPATSESFSDVWCAGIDNLNNIYVADRNHYRICKVNGVGMPTATVDSFSAYAYPNCSGPSITILPTHYSASQSVKTWFGEGSSQTDTFSAYSYTASLSHTYTYPGVYTVKHVLYRGSSIIDSAHYNYNYAFCNTIPVFFYYDSNGNCIMDSGEVSITQPILIEVDSNSIPIDTISTTSGIYYTAYGSPGDVYGFKVLSVPAALHVTCPSSGIILDTLTSGLSSTPQYLAFQCTSSSAFDLSVVSSGVRTGVHAHTGIIYSENAYCPPTNGTVTLQFSPRYVYSSAYPTPSSTTSSSLTWNLSGLSSTSPGAVSLSYHLEVSGSYLTPGDTVHGSESITPVTGDADTSNNHDDYIDTARAGYDPNEMSVSPAGCIVSGFASTRLKYAIDFENTGNDTAHNIYILDTLSDNVEASSMRIIMSSNKMYVSKIKDAAGHFILKFDFPKINLLDSSHHGQCDGAVIFTIQTKPGLPMAANIANRAGIYFDINPVVMTNPVINTIGCPVVIPNQLATVVNNNSISIYPNPANELLNIKTEGPSFESYNITDNIGKVVLSGSLTKTNTEVNINPLQSGLYFVNLKDGLGNMVVRKFVKM